jgi:hypothetical protein
VLTKEVRCDGMSKNLNPRRGKDVHITSDRGWTLIRDRGELTPPEMAHLEHCKTCNEWLTTFVNLARKSGFVISFEIPDYTAPRLDNAA